MEDKGRNSWNEYSKLVLAELEKLNENYKKFENELKDLSVKTEGISKCLCSTKEALDNLKVWREEFEKIIAFDDLSNMKDELGSLKTFRTRVLTIGGFIVTIATIYATIAITAQYLLYIGYFNETK